MNLLADILPQMSPGGSLDFFLGLVALVVLADRVVSIWSNLHSARTDTMPRTAIREELLRLERKIDEVNADRKESSHDLHNKIEGLGKSIQIALSDLGRVIGKLEGSNQMADTIKQAIVTIAHSHERRSHNE
jgi:predicted RNA-binding protein YlqC (UPF0109 family)